MGKYLLSCDLDESLLKSDKTISLRTKMYIRKFIKNGNYFVINTGRPYQSALHFYKMLKIKHMPIIGLNGTQTVFINEKYEREEYIPYNFSKELFQEFLHEVDDYLIGSHVGDINSHYLQEGGHFPIWIDKTHKGVIGVMFLEDLKNNIPDEPLLANLYLLRMDQEKVIKIINQDKYKSLGYRMWNVSEDKVSMEVHLKASNKGIAMLDLAKKLNIKEDHIIAFGDHRNDLEMLDLAYIGVAMINGKEDVKKEAKHITFKDNNHNGVIHYLKKLKIK